MPSMLDERQLVERTGLAIGTFKNWRVRRKAGEEVGPRFVKIGRAVRYKVKDVEEWEASLPVDGEDAA